ncbi:hypothetical protein [Roseofilum capinflatum]|uniref:DUF4399 domain-containing protein n=1 Tax=Roseofilum capinflatum BLCC-M114 TaxID=3022440 RepID=A0ABT7BBR4_9CYAN|nr:hypothetical protein [Roseofilum capinflatum]MDJ1176510.1 hypothetical protein [Roseofilum capinflatum BLCC-M114]
MNRNRIFYTVSLTTALTLFTIGINQPFAHGSEGEHHHSGGHSHGRLEIPPGQPIPQVNLIVHPDQNTGWNLELQVENFQFAPQNMYQENSLNEGHAHLFINGDKVTRIYGSWYYIKALPPGNHEITVVLSSNHHQDFVFEGQLIQDTEMIRVE